MTESNEDVVGLASGETSGTSALPGRNLNQLVEIVGPHGVELCSYAHSSSFCLPFGIGERTLSPAIVLADRWPVRENVSQQWSMPESAVTPAYFVARNSSCKRARKISGTLCR
ncbi:unnamed protein product [Taenia asiatica]|uniref:DUF4158 domain-containing protein n=1 Tax=Taenia asiatica TaxID=60517 RepID=A0A0R3WAL1_TAEAS|nr:unnamed protein product [Taenia asiatica]